MRDFRKVLVILPTSACVGAASGGLWRVATERSVEPHAVYQELYAEGPERETARRPGQHTLAGGLTGIFPEARTRCEIDHRRQLPSSLGAKSAQTYLRYLSIASIIEISSLREWMPSLE